MIAKIRADAASLWKTCLYFRENPESSGMPWYPVRPPLAMSLPSNLTGDATLAVISESVMNPMALIFRCCLFVCVLLCMVGHAQDAEPVPVRAGMVEQRHVPAGRVFIGTVEPARRSVIGSPVSGRVDQVFAEEGDTVYANDENGGRIVQLELETVNIELAAAKADRDVAFYELEELIRGPRKETLARLLAEVERARSQRDNQSQRLTRIESLKERAAIGQSDLDAVRSAQQSAEQALVIAEQRLAEANKGTRPEQLAQFRARLARAEQEVNKFRTRVEHHTIRAPYRGYMVARTIERGAWIQQGDPIAEIVELDPVEIRVAVPEKVISRIRLNESIDVEVDAIRSIDGHSGLLVGTVHRIVPSADSRTRSFPVRIRLQNAMSEGQPVIQPGMMAQVTLPVGPREEALLVPRDSLVLDGGKTSVFVVESADDKMTVREADVFAGSIRGSLIQVTPRQKTSVIAGMQVVTEGNERLKTGQTVILLDTATVVRKVEHAAAN